jgi:hypothetical protein
MESSPTSTFDTSTSSSGTSSGRSPTLTRCHSSGPLRASGTSHCVGSLNQLTAGPPNRPDSSSGSSTHSTRLSSTPSTTAGSLASASTISLSSTSKMTHGPDAATSVSSELPRAAPMAFGEVAM